MEKLIYISLTIYTLWFFLKTDNVVYGPGGFAPQAPIYAGHFMNQLYLAFPLKLFFALAKRQVISFATN